MRTCLWTVNFLMLPNKSFLYMETICHKFYIKFFTGRILSWTLSIHQMMNIFHVLIFFYFQCQCYHEPHIMSLIMDLIMDLIINFIMDLIMNLFNDYEINFMNMIFQWNDCPKNLGCYIFWMPCLLWACEKLIMNLYLDSERFFTNLTYTWL